MKSFSKQDKSILIVNMLDHFDGALYGFLAPIMAKIFLPNHDEIIQIILAYSLFATSLITRPIGAIIFGYWAMRFNPVISMRYSMIGVGICSILISIVPDYSSIGYGAAVILLMLRFIKGIFSAGESAIAKIYILENKENKSAYRASYIYQASTMLGILLASSLSTIVYVSDYDFLWRIAYLIAGLLGLYAFTLRNDGKSEYKQKGNIKPVSISCIWQYRYPILAIIFTTGLSQVTYLVPCVIMNSLIPFIADIDIDNMMKMNNLLLIIDFALIMLLGPIISKYDYFKVKILIPILLALSIPLMFIYLKNSGLFYVSIVRIWIVTLGVIFLIPQNLLYKNMFKDTEASYLIIGIAYAIGAASIGKLTPMIMFYLYYKYENMLVPGIYLSLIALLAGYFVWRSKNYYPVIQSSASKA